MGLPENGEMRCHKECSTAPMPHNAAFAAGLSPLVAKTPVVEYRTIASEEA